MILYSRLFRSFGLLLLVGICFLTWFVPSPDAPGFSVRAESDSDKISYIILDSDMGQVLERQNAEQITNASMLARLMTCLLALEHVSVTEMTSPSSNSTSRNGKYELSVSNSYSYDSLLKAVILGNADNAARVLAESVNSNTEYFISLMNERAAKFGMTNTYFTNVDGAYDTLQRTTVYDTALFLQNALKNVQFKSIYCSSAAIIWGATVIVNENAMVLEHDDGTSNTVGGTCSPLEAESPSDLRTMTYYYQTGKAEAETTMKLLLVMAEVGEEQYLPLGNMLLDGVLTKYKRDVLIPAGNTFLTIPVGEETLALQAPKDLYCILPLDISQFVQNISYTYFPQYDPAIITAPIEKGTILGTAHVLLKDGTLISCPMAAVASVRAAGNPVQSLFSVLQEQRELLILVSILLGLECLLLGAKLVWFLRTPRGRKG